MRHAPCWLRDAWVVLGLLVLTASGSSARNQTTPEPGSIGGRVEASGTPVRHARVVLQQEGRGVVASTATDADGRFVFETLAPGTYLIRAEKPGFVSRSTEGEAAPAAILENVYPWVLRHFAAVEVTPAKSTSITVVLDRGAAVEGTWVDARRLRNGRVLPAQTTGGGTLTINSLGLSQTPAGGPIVERIIATASGQSPSTAYPTATDDLGRFRAHSLPAGNYILYVTLVSGGAPFNWYYPGTGRREHATVITLAAGQTFAAGELPPPAVAPFDRDTFSLLPGAATDSVIEGRVLDEFGDPAPWIVVQLLERKFLAGRLRLMPLGWGNTPSTFDARRHTRTTDDLGRFRFEGLAAGEYFLSALPEPFGRADHPPETDELSGFLPVYFPGAASAAQPVRVGESDNAREVTMVLTSSRTGAIEGSVAAPPGGPEPASGLSSIVRLFYAPGGDIQPAMIIDAQIRAGRFAFRNVPAGEYVAQTISSAPVGVVVTGGAAAGLTLTRRTSVTARGRISFEGAAKRPSPSEVRIGLEPAAPTTRMFYGGRGPQRIDADWTFSNNSSWPGVMRVDAPAEWALKSVVMNGVDITDATVEFGADVTGLDVVLTSRLGGVSGTVTAAGGPTGAHGVVIFAEDRSKLTYPSRFVSIVRADADGRFSASSLLPGRYLALPLPDNRHDGVEVEWLETMRPFAVPLTVSDGKTTIIRLQGGT